MKKCICGGKEGEGEQVSMYTDAWGNSQKKVWEFPDGLVVRILGFHYRGQGSIPGQGTKIPQAVQCSQKEKRKSFNPENSMTLSGFLFLAVGAKLPVLPWENIIPTVSQGTGFRKIPLSYILPPHMTR